MISSAGSSNFSFRRVVAGEDVNGKSCILVDEIRDVVNGTPDYLQIAELWRSDGPASVPAKEDAADHHTAGFLPSKGGTRLLIEVAHPDGAGRSAEDITRMFAASGAEGTRTATEDNHDTAMHRTDTLDYVYIIYGEIYFITESGETMLRQGDTLVDAGVNHCWANRSDKPCVMLAVVVSAERS